MELMFYDVLIPLTDCSYIQEELNSDQFAGVFISKDYFFTNSDIGLFENIHTFKQVKDKILKESTCFQMAKKLSFIIIFDFSTTKNTRRI